MKLLHVIASMDPRQGGVCQAVRTIVVSLAHQSIHNEVVSLDTPNATWAQNDSFLLHTLGPGRGPWSYSASLIPWLVSNLSRFDAVIVHGLWLYHGYAVRKSLRILQLTKQYPVSEKSSLPKFLVMPHGMLDPYFQRAPGRKLKAWRNWTYWRLLEASVVNEAAGVLFTCETERLLAHEPFTPYHPLRELVVGLGVEEPPIFTPIMREGFLAKCPEARNRPYLLFLSRIQEKKGVDMLIRAYKALAGQDNPAYSEFPILIIAGPGLNTTYGQRMQELAAELAEESIFFPGMLTGSAKWGAFYGCEALVLPSHQENFGIAIVEALACNKPVLISNQVNIWQEIESTGAGIIDDDTLAGTRRLLERWCSLPKAEKQAAAAQALLAYQNYFAVAPAAQRLAIALEQICI